MPSNTRTLMRVARRPHHTVMERRMRDNVLRRKKATDRWIAYAPARATGESVTIKKRRGSDERVARPPRRNNPRPYFLGEPFISTSTT